MNFRGGVALPHMDERHSEIPKPQCPRERCVRQAQKQKLNVNRPEPRPPPIIFALNIRNCSVCHHSHREQVSPSPMESTTPKNHASTKPTIRVSLHDLAKMIDHSLLHPTMTDAEVIAGLELSKKYSVATACVKPYHIPLAVKCLAGTSVLVCPVIGFPHGNSTTQVKVFEATEAAKAGGKEIDMVINVGKALSGEWEYVEGEIWEVNSAVVAQGAILKVIFENDCECTSSFFCPCLLPWDHE